MPTETKRHRISAHTDPATGKTLVETTELSPAIAEQVADVEMSAARRRYLQAKTQKPAIEAVPIGDETFYVRSLGVSAITRTHLTASRNGDGALDLVENDDDLRKFYIVVLASCVVLGADDFTPYFSIGDAADWVDSPDVELQAICDTLFAKALAMTPGLAPKKVLGAPIPARAPASITGATGAVAPGATASISTTPNSSEPMPPNGRRGSKTTRSSATPATSPINSAA